MAQDSLSFDPIIQGLARSRNPNDVAVHRALTQIGDVVRRTAAAIEDLQSQINTLSAGVVPTTPNIYTQEILATTDLTITSPSIVSVGDLVIYVIIQDPTGGHTVLFETGAGAFLMSPPVSEIAGAYSVYAWYRTAYDSKLVPLLFLPDLGP